MGEVAVRGEQMPQVMGKQASSVSPWAGSEEDSRLCCQQLAGSLAAGGSRGRSRSGLINQDNASMRQRERVHEPGSKRVAETGAI